MSEGNCIAGSGGQMVKVPRELLRALIEEISEYRWDSLDPITAILAQPAADEQAEQQPAVWATHPKGAAVDADCGLVGAEEAKNYAPGCVTPLYAAPIAQAAPQPEKGGLVEALERYADINNWDYDGCSVSPDVAEEALATYRAALSAQGGEQ